MGKKGINNKEIIPLELVKYHQYQKRISFARARYFYASREKWLCYETKRQTGSFYRYSLISGLRRLGSPLDSPLICGGGFRIRLRGDPQIVRHYRLRGT